MNTRPGFFNFSCKFPKDASLSLQQSLEKSLFVLTILSKLQIACERMSENGGTRRAGNVRRLHGCLRDYRTGSTRETAGTLSFGHVNVENEIVMRRTIREIQQTVPDTFAYLY